MAAWVAKLRQWTPDQQALQTYMIIARQKIHGKTWVLISLPMRPNGRVGWVPRSYLGAYITSDEELIIDRVARTLVLCRAGKAVYHAPVGVGRPSLPTPAGHFWITESFASEDTFYGPWALGTSDYAARAALLDGFPDGGLVGIHGTNAPQLVPGDPSHGCMRLHNSDILRLSKLVPIGTALWIE